jgi:hypothetical protein
MLLVSCVLSIVICFSIVWSNYCAMLGHDQLDCAASIAVLYVGTQFVSVTAELITGMPFVADSAVWFVGTPFVASIVCWQAVCCGYGSIVTASGLLRIE